MVVANGCLKLFAGIIRRYEDTANCIRAFDPIAPGVQLCHADGSSAYCDTYRYRDGNRNRIPDCHSYTTCPGFHPTRVCNRTPGDDST
jgi:hypothetical protein